MPDNAPALAERVRIAISPDRMSVTATAVPPPPPQPEPDGGAAAPIEAGPAPEPVTHEEVLRALEAAGVVYGIDEGAVSEAVAIPGQPVIVARGTPATRGVDGTIQWLAEVTHTPGEPTVRDDGSVDFHHLNWVGIVRKGQVLAQKVPPQPGTPGTTVEGQKVPPAPVREGILPKGKNLIPAGDGSGIVAGCDGHLTILASGYAVLPVLEIRGNVDYSTGNIDFPGTVTVSGDVTAGFEVRATGEVLVGGAISGGTVEAAGSVRVARGILGSKTGSVKSGRDVVARFIENGHVTAAVNACVSDAIMHSRVTAGRKIEVLGRPGLVVGGLLRAGLELSCNTLGSTNGASTEVEIGGDPKDRDRFRELYFQIKQLDRELGEIENKLKPAGNPGSWLTQEMVFRLTCDLEAVRRQRLALQAEQMECLNRVESVKVGRVLVSSAVKHGVKVSIGAPSTLIEQDMGPAKFILDPNEGILIRPY